MSDEDYLIEIHNPPPQPIQKQFNCLFKNFWVCNVDVEEFHEREDNGLDDRLLEI